MDVKYGNGRSYFWVEIVLQIAYNGNDGVKGNSIVW